MKTKLISFVLLACFGLLSCNCLEGKSTIDENKFEQFCKLFQPHSLLFDWNRGEIGRLAKPNRGQDKYKEIPVELLCFVPEKIIASDSITDIRALFQLPSKDSLCFFIVATDYKYDRYGTGSPLTNILKLYLLVYNELGELKSQIIIAGYSVDQWDRLVRVDENYNLQIRLYEFLGGVIKHPSKSHLIGKMRLTKTSCEITANGTINCTSKTIKGYFDSTSNANDYELVKEVYKDD